MTSGFVNRDEVGVTETKVPIGGTESLIAREVVTKGVGFGSADRTGGASLIVATGSDWLREVLPLLACWGLRGEYNRSRCGRPERASNRCNHASTPRAAGRDPYFGEKAYP